MEHDEFEPEDLSMEDLRTLNRLSELPKTMTLRYGH